MCETRSDTDISITEAFIGSTNVQDFGPHYASPEDHAECVRAFNKYQEPTWKYASECKECKLNCKQRGRQYYKPGYWSMCIKHGLNSFGALTQTISTVLPGRLYICGSNPTGLDRISSDIKIVITIGKYDVNAVAVPGAKYVRVEIDDTPDHDDVRKLRERLPYLISLIAAGPTLVHCRSGSSRSVAVVLAYLVYASGQYLANMYNYLFLII
jgi:hypothetical protein